MAERVAARTEQIGARIAERHHRRVERWERIAEKRERRRRRRELGDPADIPRGVVLAIAAIGCLLVAIDDPALFWMVFVALGLGMSAASSFSRAARRARLDPERREEAAGDVRGEGSAAGSEGRDDPARRGRAATPAPASSVPPPPMPPPAPPDPKVARIQALCDKLLAELESGPPIVREVVTEPKATIGGLRQACLETARRERELRSVLEAQDEARLGAERAALAARVAGEQDAIVRERLGQALAALDQQLANRAELATAASRLEAENMRILYTLENLHMQLLRARSTDIGAPELGGKLRASLQELGAQIDGLAEALELASAPTRPSPPPVPEQATGTAGAAGETVGAAETDRVGPGVAEDPGASASSDDDLERAERARREAAARRARQARGT